MSLDQPLSWAVSHPWPAAATIGVLVITLAALCTIVVHKTSGAVLTAGIGALVCTAYGGDTSWAFAEHRLHMTDTSERAVMFAAGEVALIACAIMARANKQATAADDKAGTPGVPGVLVWIITGVQVIPAFAESGFWAGIVRATIGPVMGGLLWHLAMGLEIRVAKPEALSTGLPAQIGAELRQRLLSYLGLADRGRTAIDISRDRAMARAVRLAARRHRGWWGRAALKASVARSGAAIDGSRRHALLQQVAARRTAGELATVPVTSPWVLQPALEPHPATALGVTGAELRRMHPMDAIQAVHDAHPEVTPAELAALTTEYGVSVTEGLVRIALHPSAAAAAADAQPPILAVQPEPPTAALEPAPPVVQPGTDEAAFDSAAASAIALTKSVDTAAQPQPDAGGETDSADAAAQSGRVLILDLAPTQQPHPDVCAPADPAAQPTAPQATPAAPPVQPPAPEPVAQPPVQLRVPAADAQLLEHALALNEKSLAEDRRRAPLRLLQTELGIGQRRAQRIQAQLPDTLPDAAAQPPAAKEAHR
ncbi:hypothetical protein B0675_02185 [Streptomyces sp. M41(2017)]|uniref:hypothetical protein n=1 Tax=Streptomyces sp. M41(2017) TaxID=1955065 RepID=UPI0009C126E8|nr:hypothetical protein [Streptomyces sp. M41(2017)]OQQ16116.1 hypothetical protein B0675_02185 [Streptomyces sp. M41(2017)]